MTNANTETPANPTYEGWAHLTDRVLARISGPGTDKFVQGQFSQSVDEVTAGQSLRAAACTPKGRAYCITRLLRDGAGAGVLPEHSQDAPGVPPGERAAREPRTFRGEQSRGR